MKVLIAEEDPKLRYAIKVLAQEQVGWVVAGIVDSFNELTNLVLAIHPDLVILDMDLPGVSFITIEKDIEANVGKVVFLVTSPINRTPLAGNAFSKRIWISKTESPDNLLDIFRYFKT